MTSPTVENAPVDFQPLLDSSIRRLIVHGRVTLASGDAASSAGVQLDRLGQARGEIRYVTVARTHTDSDGAYRIAVADSRAFSLAVWRRGSVEVRTRIDTSDQAQVDPGPPVIRRIRRDLILPSPAAIRGHVLDETGKGIRGAMVSASWTGAAGETTGLGPGKAVFPKSIASVHSAADGGFTIDTMTAGRVKLRALLNGYSTADLTVISPVDDVVLRIHRASAGVSGHVYLHSTGEAVAGADVTFRPVLSQGLMPRDSSYGTMETDRFGEYHFETLAEGVYRLEAKKGSLGTFPSKERDGVHRVTLTSGETKSGVDLFLYPGHTIRGHVIDKDSKEPIEGVEVYPTLSDPTATSPLYTDANGVFLCTGAFGGEFELTLQKKGYEIAEPSENSRVRINLPRDRLEIERTILMEKLLSISGHVKDSSGAPIVGARVKKGFLPIHAGTEVPGVQTDESGAYTLPVRPFISARLRVSADGYSTKITDPIKLSDESVSGVDIVLDRTASISGVVVDEEDHPLEGATVVVRQRIKMSAASSFVNTHGPSSITDSEGRFRLSEVPIEGISLVATYKESSTEPLGVDLTPGEVKTGVRLVIRTSDRRRFIAGRVIDSKGNPIPNVQVNVAVARGNNTLFRGTSTQSDGRYRLEFASGDSYTIDLRHPDYQPLKTELQEVDRDDLDFTLQPAKRYRLIATVRRWDNEAPIAEFTVACANATPQKDPANPGRFIAENLAEGVRYTFNVEAEGFLPNSLTINHCPPGQDTAEYPIILGPGGSVAGRVVGGADSHPLSRVPVAYSKVTRAAGGDPYSNPFRRTTTGADGRFRLTTLPPGGGTLIVYAPKPYVDILKDVRVSHGKETDLGDLRLSGGATIRGRLVRVPGKTGVPGESIVLSFNDRGRALPTKTVTDDEGRFEFTRLLPGSYDVEADRWNLSVSIIQLADGATADVNLELGSGRLEGRVLLGNDPVDAYVSMYGPNARQHCYAKTLGHNGEFTMTDLVAGRWSVIISIGAGQPQRIQERVEIPEGGTVRKTFTFLIRRLVGMATVADGTPLVGATVKAVLLEPPANQWPTEWTSHTDPDGSFTFAAVPAGSFTVTLNPGTPNAVSVDHVTVPEQGDSTPVVLTASVQSP